MNLRSGSDWKVGPRHYAPRISMGLCPITQRTFWCSTSRLLCNMREQLLRKNWADWFPTFQGPVGYGIRDLSITTGGDVAFCHSFNRITGTRTSGEKSDVWIRATVGFRKIGGEWMIVHEHFSVPMYMEPPYKAAIDLKP